MTINKKYKNRIKNSLQKSEKTLHNKFKNKTQYKKSQK